MHGPGARYDVAKGLIAAGSPDQLLRIHPFVDRLVEHQQAAGEAGEHEERAAQQADIEVQV